jgi:DNA-binding NarL/FixJ family response regulator
LTGEVVADLAFGRQPSIDLAPFSPLRFSTAPKVRALGLVRDILFRSRIDAAAQALGVEVAYASDLQQASARVAELKPAIVFADLSDTSFPAAPTAHQLRAVTAAIRLVGFASHVDLRSLASARDAGFELTLSRSEFTARLPELLKS